MTLVLCSAPMTSHPPAWNPSSTGANESRRFIGDRGLRIWGGPWWSGRHAPQRRGTSPL
ncbi:hypothetical protein QJS66_07955 [Kocuria rhizophila]|nr:hypothetical protein QJS66_07955 [Kocuria rhizophila]